MGQDSKRSVTDKAKFYNFSEQVIDGQIKRPHSLYTRGKRRASFGELYKLKRKNLIPTILETSKEPLFH